MSSNVASTSSASTAASATTGTLYVMFRAAANDTRRNDERLRVYAMDTIESVKIRLAATYRSLPNWLYFEPPFVRLPTNGDARYDVTDVVHELRRLGATFDFPGRLVNAAVEANPTGMNRVEAERLFVAYSEALRDERQRRTLLLYNERLSVIADRLTIDVDRVWEDGDRIRQDVERQIERNVVASETRMAQTLRFESVEDAISTDFAVVRSSKSFALGATKSRVDDEPIVSLANLLDNIRLTVYVPFAAYDRSTTADRRAVLYKIKSNFIVPDKWQQLQFPERLLLKCAAEQNVVGAAPLSDPPIPVRTGVSSFDNYTTAAITFIGGALTLTVVVHVTGHRRYVDETELTRRLFTALPVADDAESIRASVQRSVNVSVTAQLIYPRTTLIDAVFADFVLNDPIFQRLLVIDEFRLASRRSHAIFARVVSTTWEERVALRNARTTRPYQYGMAEAGTPYIACRLRTNDPSGTDRLRRLIDKLMRLYAEDRDSVIDAYAKYLPAQARRWRTTISSRAAVAAVATTEEGRAKLRQIAPDVFPSRYTRHCLMAPSVVTDERALDLAREGYQSLKFPTDATLTRQRWYSCWRHPTSPFVGLIPNNQENQATFPHLPCCYRTDQNRPGSPLARYIAAAAALGESVTLPPSVAATTEAVGGSGFRAAGSGAAASTKEVHATGKILAPNVLGVLPRDIVRLLVAGGDEPWRSSIGGGGGDEVFYRLGVERGPLSAVECVMIAVGQLTSAAAARRSDAERASIRDAYERIVNDATLVEACVQETIVNGGNEARRMRDSFVPSRYVRALELAFDCNIFVFAGDDDFARARLVVPTHRAFYAKYVPYRPTAFLFEHRGSEQQRLAAESSSSGGDYRRQCELIVSVERLATTKSRRQTTTIFPPRHQAVARVWLAFTRLTRTNLSGGGDDDGGVCGGILAQPSTTVAFDATVVDQLIDANGKCAVVAARSSSNNVVTIVCDRPLPPFRAASSSSLPTPFTRRCSANDILTLTALRVVGRVVVNGRLREVSVALRDIDDDDQRIFGVALCDDDERAIDAPVDASRERYAHFAERVDNEYFALGRAGRFARDERVARSLLAYATYAYSRYLDGTLPSNATLTNFYASNVRVSDDAMTAVLRRHSPIIGDWRQVYDVGANRLRVPDEETGRRLAFALRLMSVVDGAELVRFRERRAEPAYYRDAGDFVKRFGEIVVEGESALRRRATITATNDASNYSASAIDLTIGDDDDDGGGEEDGDDDRTTAPIPYFFSNDRVEDGKLFVARNCRTLADAVFYARPDRQPGGDGALSVADVDVYAYRNAREIEKIGGGGGDGSTVGCVLAFEREANASEFVALTPVACA